MLASLGPCHERVDRKEIREIVGKSSKGGGNFESQLETFERSDTRNRGQATFSRPIIIWFFVGGGTWNGPSSRNGVAISEVMKRRAHFLISWAFEWTSRPQGILDWALGCIGFRSGYIFYISFAQLFIFLIYKKINNILTL